MIDRFIAGVNENDVDAVDAATTGWAAGGFTGENIDEYTLERGDLSRTNSEDGRATLKADLTITHDGESRTDRTSFVVVDLVDGWGVDQILVSGGFVVGGTTLAPPMASIASSYDRNATSNEGTGVLTLTHESEGTLPTNEMSVHGTITDPDGAGPDITTDGAVVRDATGRSRFSSGDTLTIGVEHEYDVSVHYTKENTGDTVFLGEFSHS